jgi:uncharacterized protein YceH (UPF0502 family)
MSETVPSLAAGPWPSLDVKERRVLGVLVEKQKTSKSADGYPLSLNSLVTGCNQKSNREPVLNLEEEEVEQTVLGCLKKNLVARVTSTRVMRWRHLLYETWHVDKIDLAILAELLLRGPQTEGELRTRVCRMEPIDDLDSLRAALKPLSQRKLVVYLTPEGRRGTVVTHGFHEPRELERLRAHYASQPASSEAPIGMNIAPGVDSAELEPVNELRGRLTAAEGEIATLKATVGNVQTLVATLQQELLGLKRSLGG